MVNTKQFNYLNLSVEQRIIAVQRLTALWAFCESGLGGLLHVLQIPFTGLIIGGLAVINITLITKFSENRSLQLFQSLLVVLTVKAMVSPYSPFPAYIAVSFQALLGFVLYRLFQVNLLSLLLLGIITMLESAVQKLLLLTLFFGTSFWKAIDDMMAYITTQMGFSAKIGSQWAITVYLLIYVAGGILVAGMTYKIIKSFSFNNKNEVPVNGDFFNYKINIPVVGKSKNIRKKILLMILALLIVSILLFVFAADAKQGWVAVLKTVCWTLSAIMIWYLLIGPLFTRLILRALQKKAGRYSESISRTLSFLPVLRPLTTLAWQKSKDYNGWNRMYYFFITLVCWSLVYSELPDSKQSLNSPV